MRFVFMRFVFHKKSADKNVRATVRDYVFIFILVKAFSFDRSQLLFFCEFEEPIKRLFPLTRVTTTPEFKSKE